MKLEIQSASNFITHLIRLNHRKKVSEGKLFKFRQYLINGMRMRYRDHWFPEKPQKGCGYRTIRCNDKLDPLIAQAGEVCGLSEDLLKKNFSYVHFMDKSKRRELQIWRIWQHLYSL